MKTNLMRGMFKFSKFPKCFAGNLSILIILNIVINFIICHWAFYYIIGMWNSFSARKKI